MQTLRLIYHMTRADFLERSRRTSFLVILGLALLAGYAYIPPTDSTTLSVALGPWRGLYNSAWIGIVFGLLTVILMPVFGYFRVKNSIERDRRTRVGQIIATTPVSKPVYVLGKWMSNLVTLSAMLLVFNLMALVMQLLRAEVSQVELWALSAPIWLMGFPVIALTAALAIWFESVPFLSGSLGNVVYFIAWLLFLEFIGLPGVFEYQIGQVEPHHDVLGLTYPLAALQEVSNQISPGFAGHFNFGGADYGVLPQAVEWQGLDWDWTYMLGRLSWLAAALGIAALAALPFDRFDPARASVSQKDSPLKRFLSIRKKQTAEPAFVDTVKVQLSPLADRVSRSRFASLLVAELKLMLKGHPWWWYAAAAFISLLGLAGPPGGGAITPQLAVLWPVAAWSWLGTRENSFDTAKLIFSSTHPLKRQMWAAWSAGVLLALVALTPVSLRLAIEGEAGRLSAFVAAALFIPSLAMALGSLSKSPRLFEVVYLCWWFLGANGVKPLDFMQGAQNSLQPVLLVSYLTLAGIFLLLGIAVRRRMFTV